MIRALRFDDGVGYVSAIDPRTANTIIHGANPALEGKPTPADSATGQSLAAVLAAAVRSSDEGLATFMFPKPGQTVPLRKFVAVAKFAPWDDMVLSAGAYTDDLDAAFRSSLLQMGAVGGLILLIAVLAAWLVQRDVTRSLGGIRGAMGRLAKGDLDAAVPGAERRDEVGQMAAALQVLKEGLQRAERLSAEQEQVRARAEEAKRDALVAMADAIEGEARDAMTEVGQRTAAMAETANAMSGSAAHTGEAAEGAAAAASQALANAETVASAAEQLSASIREIGGQVDQSTKVVARAVEAGRGTRETMQALNEQIGRIGSVAGIIGEIASKTNLLALNATIEAARAGEAGRGFAVVASEVKQLATQTAQSTEQISRHIAEVHAATSASVAAVGRMEETIGEVNAIASSIAAAVEEQSAATAEIARNVTETATAANEMTRRSTDVSAEAGRTGQRAAEVLANTTALNEAIRDLQRAVVHIVRTSTGEVDRRRVRRRPCLVEASLTLDGQTSAVLLHDVAEHGCCAVGNIQGRPGQHFELAIPRFGVRQQATVTQQSERGLHVAFTGEGLSAEAVDRMSLETVPEMVQLAKSDHAAFVARIADAVSKGEVLPSGSVAHHHACRFGRWYDHIADPATLALASFKAIAEPHREVHQAGHQALDALAAGNAAAAQAGVATMRQHSARVLQCLDAFGREFPSTVMVDRPIAA